MAAPYLDAPAALLVAVFVTALLPVVKAITQEIYTTNMVCRQNRCTNPVFPALYDMQPMERQRWKKQSLAQVYEYLEFCKDVVDYDVGLPLRDYSNVWNWTAHTVPDLVVEQDNAASKAYFYHLAGLGLEPWDYKEPTKASVGMQNSACAESIARMACFTYFPQAMGVIADGTETSYMRPCKSCCENYVKACEVECCDGSVNCVFDLAGRDAAREGINVYGQLIEMGYIDENGPSAKCTGGARRRAAGTVAVAAAGLLATAAGLHLGAAA